MVSTTTSDAETVFPDGPARPSGSQSPDTDRAAALAGGIAGLSTVISAVCVLAMLVVTLLGVLSREVDFHLIRNHEEWSGYLMAAFAVTAMPGAFHANAFVRVDVVLDRISGRARSIVMRVFLALAVVYCSALAYYSFQLAARSKEYGSHSVGGAEVALVIPQGATAFGLLLFLLYMVCRLASRRTEVGKGERSHHE